MSHFANLAPHELEALALLAEELSEAGQVIGKILRHGLDSRHPNGGLDNRALLENELGDVRAAVRILSDLGVIGEHNVESSAGSKMERVARYLHHIDVVGRERGLVHAVVRVGGDQC